VVDGKLVSRRVARPPRGSVALAPISWTRRFWNYLGDSWLFNHYKAGFVSALLLLDTVAIAMCWVDYDTFSKGGLKPISALRVAFETVGENDNLKAAVLVLVFFAGVPFLTGLFPHFANRNDRQRSVGGNRRAQDANDVAAPALRGWRRVFLTKGWWVVGGHFLFAFAISVFTLLAQSMQTLSGWRGQASTYSFASSWMWVVGGINWLYSVIVFPVFLKFAARSVGQERPHFGEVLREVSTEFSAEH
jgi:hypothetical protein